MRSGNRSGVVTEEGYPKLKVFPQKRIAHFRLLLMAKINSAIHLTRQFCLNKIN
ncbi:hypothetical protein H1P_3240003 [Hyella patelloides LEGE 07179]|uniref:Uncharacterized protein n=1 Tax=Hyella patelloides LEGE 07179 TaxID=945734 RepID=A0A563VV69_9CYAN|nr:hypothetical protein H1P_3240003 [Hyella patelloides LEGE 07179]